MNLSLWDIYVMEQIAQEEKQKKLKIIASHLAENYSGAVDYDTFREACWDCNINPLDFEDEDIRAIQELLDLM